MTIVSHVISEQVRIVSTIWLRKPLGWPPRARNGAAYHLKGALLPVPSPRQTA